MTPHPSLPGEVGDDVADSPASWPVASSQEHYATPYVTLTFDTIVAPDGGEHGRAVVRPNGAVGVLALDDDDRVLLVEQYRHAVQRRMVELPAGTLDVEGEAPQDAAARELAEEADVVADTWDHLLSSVATPGYSSEEWELYRATGLRPVPDVDRTSREAEEADMRQWWVPFGTAVDAVLDGRITDAMTAAGILAEQVKRSRP